MLFRGENSDGGRCVKNALYEAQENYESLGLFSVQIKATFVPTLITLMMPKYAHWVAI